jgi:WD40 repeat protein
VAHDRRQLAGQLTGRLLSNASPSIQALLKQAAEKGLVPWLRPLNSSLTAPGGPLVRTLEGHTGPVRDVAVTPDGRHAVSASYDQTLRLWDLESGQSRLTLEGHRYEVSAVAVTPDGCRAVSGGGKLPDEYDFDNLGSDYMLRLWDLSSGQTIHTLEGHTRSVRAVAVMPDGCRAVSASEDQTLRLWDLESGKEVATFTGESDMDSCAISPDGQTIIAGDASGRVHVLQIVEADETKPQSS